MEKILKNKSFLLGLVFLAVLGFGILIPKTGYAVECTTACTAPKTCDTTSGQCVDATPANSVKPDSGCSWYNPLSDACLSDALAWFGNLILIILSALLFMIAKLFEFSARLSLMGWYGNMPVIKSAWVICRDLANTAFVFILLYISLGTILKLSGVKMKEMLVKTLIMAIVVNFSMAATKIMIDVSNVLAIEFYNKMNSGAGAEIKNPWNGDLYDVGITGKIFNGLSLQSIFEDDTSAQASTGNSKTLKVIVATFGGSILIILISAILLVATVLFLSRTLTFMFLLILSPFAFVASVIPGGSAKGQAKKWWDKMMNQVIFAPAFMFLLYLVTEIVDKGALFASLQGATDLPEGSFGGEGGALTGLLTSSMSGGSLLLVINYMLIGGLLMGTIIISKAMGADGAKWATDQFDKNVVGRMQGAAKGAAGWVGGKAADSRAGRAVTAGAARIPLIGGGIAKARSTRDEAKSTQSGQFNKLTRGQLMERARPSNFNKLSLADQRDLLSSMSKYSGALQGMDRSALADSVKSMGRQGMDISRIIGANPELLNDKNIVSGLTPSSMANLNESAIAGREVLFASSFLADNARPEHLQSILARADGDKLKEAFVNEIQNMGGTSRSASAAAASLGTSNKGLADFIRTNSQVRDMLGLT